MPSFSSLGIGSGLNLNDILSKIMAAESLPLSRLTAREKADTDRITALGHLKSIVADFNDSVENFTKAQKINVLSASSSDSTTADISTNEHVLPGEYNITIQQLATNQKLRSVGFAGPEDIVGEGTLHIELGSYTQTTGFVKNNQPPVDITIDANNHSLAGIRDAINHAQVGITANIIQAGTEKGAHLVLTGANTGTQNTIHISVTPPTGSTQTTLSQLTFDPAQHTPTALIQIQAAQDALFSLDGLTITNNENVVTDKIAGVTLTLNKTTADNQSVHVSIKKDLSRLQPLLKNFVSTYNKAVDALDQAAQKGSILDHDSTVHTVQRDLYEVLTIPVQTTNSTVRRLSDLGISSDKTGHLSFQTDLFNQTVAQPGFSATQFFMGRIDSSSRYVTVEKNQGSTAQADTPTTARIDVITEATQGSTRGDFVLSTQDGVTITAGDNDVLQMQIGQTTTPITIAAGHYTPEQLKQLLNQACRNNDTLKDIMVDLATAEGDQDHNQLIFTNTRYGTDSTVTVGQEGAASSLLGNHTTTQAGQNVSILYNGQQVTGQGQMVDVGDWQIKVASPTPEKGIVIEFLPGFGPIAQKKLAEALGKNGPLLQDIDGFKAAIKEYDHQREALRAELDALQKQYEKKFQALDLYITKMNQTSNFIRSMLKG